MLLPLGTQLLKTLYGLRTIIDIRKRKFLEPLTHGVLDLVALSHGMLGLVALGHDYVKEECGN